MPQGFIKNDCITMLETGTEPQPIENPNHSLFLYLQHS